MAARSNSPAKNEPTPERKKREMKKTTLKTRLWALAATLLLLISLLAMPVSADNDAATGGEFTFNKYLVMEKNVVVPNVTFNFTITAATSTNPAVESGIGKPTVGSAAFTSTYSQEDIYESVQTVDGVADSLTLPEGKVYAKLPVTVDFSSISFPNPGVYRYTVTEEATNQDGITDDTTTRTLDVYVGYKDNSETELEVMGYVMYNGTITTTTGETKSNGFTNTYGTKNLTLTKNVEGNQGNRDKYFRFEVIIANAVAGTKYTVTVPSGLTEGDLEGSDQLSDVNKTELVATGGSVTAVYYLKDGQSITIHGLTPATTYAISEASYAADGYTTKYKIDAGTDVEGNSFNEAQTMRTDNHTVTFTNSKSGTVPTGILLETAPYLILGAVVVAGLVVLFATRRRRTRE